MKFGIAMVRRVLFLCLPILILVCACVPLGAASTHAATKQVAVTAPGVKVVGHHIVRTDTGATLHLRGIDRSGTEYACIQGWGYGEGSYDQGEVTSMLSWHLNAVRIPLNEDCWLNINMGSSTKGGAGYQTFVKNYVTLLENSGITPILDLHWNAPGTQQATGQQVMADSDHSATFWSSVAGVFGKDNRIMFDLYNEPHDITWSCWEHGGCKIGSSGWSVAGMGTLINAVRSAGGINVLMAGGLAWANDLSGWLANKPYDSLGELSASWHSYNCDTGCNNSTVQTVAGNVPVIAGEIGAMDGSNSTILVAEFLDSMNQSYLAWDWSTSACPCDVTSTETGTPSSYGQPYHDYVRSKQ